MSTWKMNLSAERADFVSTLVERSDIWGLNATGEPWKTRLQKTLSAVLDGEYVATTDELMDIIRETQAPAAYLVLAEARLRQGQCDLALVVLDVLLCMDPGCAEALLMKGLVCCEQESWMEARDHLHAAITQAPSLLLGWRTLIDLALEQDDTQEAARLLNEAILHRPAYGLPQDNENAVVVMAG